LTIPSEGNRAKLDQGLAALVVVASARTSNFCGQENVVCFGWVHQSARISWHANFHQLGLGRTLISSTSHDPPSGCYLHSKIVLFELERFDVSTVKSSPTQLVR
jgi:hypothetical protein